MSAQKKKLLKQKAASITQQYGDKAGSMASTKWNFDVVPTGSLALDFAMGTMGWPMGHPCECYGKPDIGKSSTLGLSAFRNAQAKGYTTALIAVEPGFDPSWAEKHGVDNDMLLIARPLHAEEAFNMLYDFMTDDLVDFVIFDSIGALVPPSEAQEGAKVQMMGAANIITSGVRRILQPCWRNNKGLIFLNQIRDNTKSPIPGAVEPPGGHLVKHACDIRVELKQASGKEAMYKEKIDGDDILVGRKLVAHVKRNKMSEGTNQKASFDFYQKSTVDHPVGIDVTADVIATGTRTGVIQRRGGYYVYEGFSGDKHQVQGKAGVAKALEDDSSLFARIRDDVTKVMVKRQGPAKDPTPDLEAFDKAVEEEMANDG